MASISEYTKAILIGGLPAALDLGSSAKNQQGDTRTEQTAPAGTVVDQDTATVRVPVITPTMIAIGVGTLVVVTGILFLSFRAVR